MINGSMIGGREYLERASQQGWFWWLELGLMCNFLLADDNLQLLT